MKTFVDSACFIGATHTVCQDYARAVDLGPNTGKVAVLSDGCSSSPDTDLGSRILVHEAIRRLSLFGPDLNGELLIKSALEKVPFGVSQRCLDATLLILTEDDDNINARMWGDGVLFCVRHDKVEVWEIDCNNAPNYLSYHLDPNAKACFLEQGYGERTVRRFVNGVLEYSFEIPADEAMDPFQLTTKKDQFEFIGVASDGMTTFVDPENPDQLVPLPVAATKLLNIKVPAGQFLLRSQTFHLKPKKTPGWKHLDDYSIAGFSLVP